MPECLKNLLARHSQRRLPGDSVRTTLVFRRHTMIRTALVVLAISTTSVYAQEAAPNAATAQTGASTTTAGAGAADAAAAAGVTGFTPLVAPALGVLAAGVGLAAAGGGSSTPTTSTVSTNLIRSVSGSDKKTARRIGALFLRDRSWPVSCCNRCPRNCRKHSHSVSRPVR